MEQKNTGNKAKLFLKLKNNEMRRIELDEFYEFDKQISEELKNNEMTVKNFYKENYPHDYIGSAGAYIRKNLLFKTVLKRMKKGEDFYKIVFKDNYADSIARERIFEGMAQNLKIDYEEIYFIWLKN